MFWRKYDMTRRTGDRTFASAFQVDIVFVCEGENVVPFVSFDGFDQLPSGVLEMNFDPVVNDGRDFFFPLVNGER